MSETILAPFLETPVELPPGPQTPEEETDRLDYFQAQKLTEWAGVLNRARPNFEYLAKQLKEPIEEHYWDSVIGDDTRGRLPAIFVHHLMKRYARETGYKLPTLLFIAPMKESKFKGFKERRFRKRRERAMRQYLKRREQRIGRRALVATEYIASGGNIRQILQALPKQVNFDVASLAIGSSRTPDKYSLRHHAYHRGDPQVYYSEGGSPTPEIYAASTSNITGREKNYRQPTSLRSNFLYDPKIVHGARGFVVNMADEIYDSVFRNSATRS